MGAAVAMSHRHESPSRQAGRLRGLGLAFAVLALCLPVSAAELMKVRVGAHEGFTRVVFELDRTTGYRVEKTGRGAATELRVTLDAGTGAHEVGAHGDVRGVEVSPGRSAVARIPLSRGDLRLQEMILADPPRIVLDLRRPEPPAAAKPAPAPAEKPAAVAKRPAPEAQKPAPVAEKPAPGKQPAPVAKQPAPAPEKPAPVAKQPAPAPAKPVAVTPAKPEPAPAAEPSEKPVAVAESPEPVAPEKALAPSPGEGLEPGPARRDSRPDATSVARPITPEPRPIARKPASPAPARPAPKAAETTPAAPTTTPGWTERLTSDPLWLGAMAGGFVALVGIVVTLRRRSRALPGDLDVEAISSELDGEDAEGAAPQQSASDASPFGEAPGSQEAPVADSDGHAELPADPDRLAAAGSEFDVEAPSAPPTSPSTDSIFDDAPPGEAPMNQNTDLPADRSSMASPPPPGLGATAMGEGAGSSDVAQMLEAFERRIQGLEARLEEANEAREKLERQVAAQSEELRVQRAAIARTQRALRTMSRGDEDKATEPALREGDTQAKTRING